MRNCACVADRFEYTFDVDRGWWVHSSCGWPTRAWFESAGTPAPNHLTAMRPVTYHDFVTVPRSPKTTYDRLSDEQKRVNDDYVGRSVRD